MVMLTSFPFSSSCRVLTGSCIAIGVASQLGMAQILFSQPSSFFASHLGRRVACMKKHWAPPDLFDTVDDSEIQNNHHLDV